LPLAYSNPVDRFTLSLRWAFLWSFILKRSHTS
jgi:hypothetical protein